MSKNQSVQDKLQTTDLILAEVQFNNSFGAEAQIDGTYNYVNTGPIEERREEYVELRDLISVLEQVKQTQVNIVEYELNKSLSANFFKRIFNLDHIASLREELAFTQTQDETLIAKLKAELASIPTETKWEDALHNLITTVGKNNILDNHFSGSAYTAAWFVGLIDNASFTALAAADTMASHAGWVEFVGYSNATRIAPSWSTAAAGSKAFSTPASFNINAGGTLNGGFINSVSTKSGTTGVLCSEGSFAATRVVANGDTLNVSYASTLT